MSKKVLSLAFTFTYTIVIFAFLFVTLSFIVFVMFNGIKADNVIVLFTR